MFVKNGKPIVENVPMFSLSQETDQNKFVPLKEKLGKKRGQDSRY